ncbi:MAG: SDR family oxidoreductase [Propionivibrio sp.]|jgi:NAD(P)-dependent dehydrogenase (short-subunit alcohol dehydrogenase family)|nr:SDR family oxidoreductase [Propionivibrio sp.]MBP6710804.1 SDR family oxidoreductase [Propionivibrio sp.]MBP7523151.1 SDR family oxidoreductase [Propionivibrio sp.]MBP8162584.1 SDR family oxidoreductase [Propionivibrio sp.]
MKAILTGHTRGLGAAIAEQLLARDIPVLGLARSGNAALAARYPALLTEIALDLSDPATLLAALAGETVKDFVASAQSLLLINNAGMLQPVGRVEMQDAAAIARTVSLNVAAPLMLTSGIAAQMKGRPCRVLHISSGAGRHAYPGWSIYCATKAALDQHASVIALDQSPGLKICSVAPGVVDTDMQTEVRAIPPEQFPMRERFIKMKNEGTLTPPSVAAGKLLDYLLSDAYGTVPLADVRELA